MDAGFQKAMGVSVLLIATAGEEGVVSCSHVVNVTHSVTTVLPIY